MKRYMTPDGFRESGLPACRGAAFSKILRASIVGDLKRTVAVTCLCWLAIGASISAGHSESATQIVESRPSADRVQKPPKSDVKPDNDSHASPQLPPRLKPSQPPQDDGAPAQTADKVLPIERKGFWDQTFDNPVAVFNALFNLGLLVATCGLWWMAIRQSRDTRTALVLTQRPKLRLRNIVINKDLHSFLLTAQGELVSEPWHMKGNPIRGQFFVSNIGCTPATITESLCIAYWNQEGLPMKRPYEGRSGNAGGANLRLSPGEAIPLFFLENVMDERGATAGTVIDGALHVYVMGWVEYKDDNRGPRRTAFCREFRKTDSQAEGRFYPVDDPDYEHEE